MGGSSEKNSELRREIEEKRAQVMKEIRKADRVSKKSHVSKKGNIPHAQKEYTLEVMRDALAEKIHAVISRNAHAWKCLSEAPLEFKEEPRSVLDMRPVSLKKKYIEFVKHVQIREKEAGSKSSSSCAICMQAYRSNSACGVLGCSHVFHKTCILLYMRHSGMCPMCRKDVISGIAR